MYPIRSHLTHGDSARFVDRDRLHRGLAAHRAPDGAAIVHARSHIRGPHIQVISFVAALTPESAVSCCRGAFEALTRQGDVLDGCRLTRCSLGFGGGHHSPGTPAPSAPWWRL